MGGIPGFETVISRYPETKNCIIVLSNLVDMTRNVASILQKLEEILLGIEG